MKIFSLYRTVTMTGRARLWNGALVKLNYVCKLRKNRSKALIIWNCICLQNTAHIFHPSDYHRISIQIPQIESIFGHSPYGSRRPENPIWFSVCFIRLVFLPLSLFFAVFFIDSKCFWNQSGVAIWTQSNEVANVLIFSKLMVYFPGILWASREFPDDFHRLNNINYIPQA